MKKEVVFILGGLGNQMFQYAFYIARKEQMVNAKFSISQFRLYSAHNGFELERVFGIQPEHRALILYNKLSKVASHGGRKYVNLILDKLGIARLVVENENMIFLPSEFNTKSRLGVTLWAGYWQSEGYFLHIRDKILDIFSFDESKISSSSYQVLQEISDSESVSVHVRRGDYLLFNHLYGDICTLSYYNTAIKEIEKKASNPIYFIFSDDIDWCRENLNINNAIFVTFNAGADSWQDMFLMSKCKHNIIANSSFSWWGAWLNRNNDKIVIAPSRFLNTSLKSEIVPQSWHSVEV